MKQYHVTDSRFGEYGRVIAKGEADLSDMLAALSEIPVPENEVDYIPSVESLEACGSKEILQEQLFGGMPVQAGCCMGHNTRMNAVEYHKSSEINAATEDIVLLLGRRQDIQEDGSYDSSLLEAFLVPKGTVIEIYATTLHYAPCQTSENGFAMLVVLPAGSNTKLPEADRAGELQGEARLLLERNKWLTAHPEGGVKGAFTGIRGENLQI